MLERIPEYELPVYNPTLLEVSTASPRGAPNHQRKLYIFQKGQDTVKFKF